MMKQFLRFNPLAALARTRIGLAIAAVAIIGGATALVVNEKPAEAFMLVSGGPSALFVSPVLGNRLRDLSTNPTLRNFAQDSSQAAIRKVAKFIAPSVEVPAMTGQYKRFDARHRYKRPITRRAPDGRATRIGFTADDSWYNLAPNALDFPIPNVETMDDGGLLNYAKYGAVLLADSSGLAHEGEVIDRALAAIGAGVDHNFAAAGTDPIKLLNAEIIRVKKLAKNGAKVKVLFGTTAFLRTSENDKVISRFRGGSGGAKAGGASLATPQLEDMSRLLFGNPDVEMSELVEDKAAEGVDEDIQFLLDEAILIFASNDVPNTMDAAFMKTFRLMGQWMTPGAYESEDKRDQILKMDWHEQIVVTNAPAAVRLNARDAA